jgi:hypothetical protein
MTQKSIRIIIIAIVLSLCIIITALPVSAADAGGCTRSYNIVLELTPQGVTEKAVEIVYGSSLHPADAPGTLVGKVQAADDKILQEFPLWDPRVQFGEDIVVDEKGNVTRVNGISKRESRAMLAVMFPQSPDAARFSLYDEKGTLMKNVNLTHADNKATWNCTADYGIPQRSYNGGVGPGLPVLVIAGVIILVFAAGAGWFLLKKKKPREKTP